MPSYVKCEYFIQNYIFKIIFIVYNLCSIIDEIIEEKIREYF